MRRSSQIPAWIWWLAFAAVVILAVALMGWRIDAGRNPGKSEDFNVMSSDAGQQPGVAAKVIPSYPGTVPSVSDEEQAHLAAKAETTARWEIAKLIYFARRDEATRLMQKWPPDTRPDKEEEARMVGINNRELELLRPWRMMDLWSDETPIGEGHSIGEMVRDLFTNTNYLEVARDEIAQSLREVGAGEAAVRAESIKSVEELMFVAKEYRETVETYVDKMYDEAQVTTKWREMFEDRSRFAALDRLSRVYNESLDDSQTGNSR